MRHAPTPDVSVIVPVFDGERHIGAALASIRDSCRSGGDLDVEVIVVDAGSSDATASIAASIAERDHRFRLVRSAERLTAPAARNRALAEVRAPIVACLDHDDQTVSGRLARHVGILRSDPGIAAVGGSLVHIDATGLPVVAQSTPRRDLGVDATRYLLPFHCPTLTSAMTYRTSALHAVGGFVEDRPYADDYHLFAALFDHGGVRMLGEPAARYRTHSSQLSNRRRPEQHLEVVLLRQRLAAGVLGSPPPIGVVWAWRSASAVDAPTRRLAVEFLDRYHDEFLARFAPTGDDLTAICEFHRHRRDQLTGADVDTSDIELPP